MNSSRHADPVPDSSADLLADQIELLREAFPHAFTEGRVDFDKLRAALGDQVDDRPERYTFTWAGKRDAIRLLQTPTRATLVPYREESVNFDTTQHLFIEGDNLEVLKLLYKPYFGRVKMIYIDPPYNTGNDFIYPDNYADPLATYLQLTGQADAEGNLLTSNPETSGRYHSAWLSMMYPRLFLARQLLREDGVIFVSIDDHEVHNLRLLMNEVFGEENFIVLVVVQTNPRGRTLDRFLAKTHEYVMVFAKEASQQAITQIPKDAAAMAAYSKRDEIGQYRELELRNRNPMFTRANRPNLFYPIYADPATGKVALEPDDPHIVPILPLNSKGEDGCWTWGKDKARRQVSELLARQVVTGAWRVYRKDYVPPEGATTKEKALWLNKALNHENGKEEMGRLFGKTPFDFPKSVELIKKCLMPSTSATDPDIVLDFFAGSCTTSQAVLELNREDDGNRRFIMVQLPEPTDNAQYPTIADIGKERIRRVIARMNEGKAGQLPPDTGETPEDLGLRVFKLAPSHFQPWSGAAESEPTAYAQQMALFTDPLAPGWTPEAVIYEIALKEGYSLNCRIATVGAHGRAPNTLFRVTDPDRDQSFTICLDPALHPDTVQALQLTQDDLFICRDVALTDDLAANLALQCRLKTI